MPCIESKSLRTEKLSQAILQSPFLQFVFIKPVRVLQFYYNLHFQLKSKYIKEISKRYRKLHFLFLLKKPQLPAIIQLIKWKYIYGRDVIYCRCAVSKLTKLSHELVDEY